jgi:hypothetical protein
MGVDAPSTPAPIIDDPLADKIYHAARVAWGVAGYPRYATYIVDVTYTKNTAQSIERHYDTFEDLQRNFVYARTLSSEERADTPAPRFFNFVFTRKPPDDPLGSFAVGINNDYGLAIGSKPITAVNESLEAAQAPKRLDDDDDTASDDASKSPSSPSLVVIGRTQITDRTYAVRLIETLDEPDGKTYHLGLTPLRNPERHRLRELWIDAQTSLVKRILVATNFNRAPLNKVAWLIDYRIVDGAPYIARETAEGPLDFGRAGHLTNVTISFEDVQPLARIPVERIIGITTPPDVVDAY